MYMSLYSINQTNETIRIGMKNRIYHGYIYIELCNLLDGKEKKFTY